MQGLAFVLSPTRAFKALLDMVNCDHMLNNLIVTEAEEGWFLTFNGLMTTEESIQIDEKTAKVLLHLHQLPV